MPHLTDEERQRTRRWVAQLDADRATLADEVEADVAQYRDMTPEQANRLRIGVVEGSWAMLQSQPDKQKVLDYRDPPAPDFERVWQRLVEQGRALRSTHADKSGRPE